MHAHAHTLKMGFKTLNTVKHKQIVTTTQNSTLAKIREQFESSQDLREFPEENKTETRKVKGVIHPAGATAVGCNTKCPGSPWGVHWTLL